MDQKNNKFRIIYNKTCSCLRFYTLTQKNPEKGNWCEFKMDLNDSIQTISNLVCLLND